MVIFSRPKRSLKSTWNRRSEIIARAFWRTNRDSTFGWLTANPPTKGHRSKAPDRLQGVGVVSLQDPDGAAKELARIKELGMKSVMINGTAGAKRLDHPDHDPFFAEADRLKLPIAVHFSL